MHFRKLPPVTKKQEEIITLVYRFRFINRAQLQRLFNHKDARRINTWLRDLVAKNYLGRIYSRKLLENTKPAIYYLQNNGIIWIRYEKGEEYDNYYGQLDIKYLKKFYEDRNASLTFINHCITLFEFYLQFKEYEREENKDFIKKRKKRKDYDEELDKKVDYYVETKTEMWIQKRLRVRDAEDFDEIKQYIPDLYFEKMKYPGGGGKMESSTFFLELFDPKVPRYAIKYRIKQYIKLKEEGNWKHQYTGMDGKFPTIILVFPNQQKLNFLSGFVKEQLEDSYESEGVTFLLTTYQKAMTQTLLGGPKIWKVIQEE
jgi:hypothetical protein